MATVVRSVGVIGIEGFPIAVQVKFLAGVVTMNIVGLRDQAVKEAKDRIESAFDHLRLEFPKKKIVVNLSPSGIKKSGAYLDLPMLIDLLIESEQLAPPQVDLNRTIFLGEVGLNGDGEGGRLSVITDDRVPRHRGGIKSGRRGKWRG